MTECLHDECEKKIIYEANIKVCNVKMCQICKNLTFNKHEWAIIPCDINLNFKGEESLDFGGDKRLGFNSSLIDLFIICKKCKCKATLDVRYDPSFITLGDKK